VLVLTASEWESLTQGRASHSDYRTAAEQPLESSERKDQRSYTSVIKIILLGILHSYVPELLRSSNL
jgi:hypothetical protein